MSLALWIAIAFTYLLVIGVLASLLGEHLRHRRELDTRPLGHVRVGKDPR